MTDTALPEAFQLDSGLRDDMVISVHSAYFAPHAEYMDGKALLLWLIGIDENEEAVDVRLSVGTDWQTDDGNIITHPTKRKQHINKNSIYGHWLSFSFQIPELAKILIERSEALGGKGPCDSRIWLDLNLHLENRTLEFGPRIPNQERLMPTEFLGLTTDQSPTTLAPTPAPSEAEQAQLSPAELVAQAQARKAQEAPGTSENPLYDRAVKMAQEAPDYATFLATALNDDEILADDDLAVRVADESQIWAEAHK